MDIMDFIVVVGGVFWSIVASVLIACACMIYVELREFK